MYRVIIGVEDNNMDSRTWNLMIMMINNKEPRAKAEQLFSKKELKVFDSMNAQLTELRKSNPSAAFSPVETDW